MAGGMYFFYNCGIVLGYVTGNEKSGLYPVLVEQIQDHIHTAVRAVLAHRAGADEFIGVGLVRRHVLPDDIAVEVKSKHGRALAAVGPFYSLHIGRPLYREVLLEHLL